MSTPSHEALAAAKALYPKTAAALAEVESAETMGAICVHSQAREGIHKAARIIDEHFAKLRDKLDVACGALRMSGRTELADRLSP